MLEHSTDHEEYILADTRSASQRRYIMQSVGQKNTGPEVAVRRLLHRLGYRFRLHRKDLPGKPDIVFPSRKMVIFVHGCYWHGHMCHKGKLPKSRLEYWGPKIARNQERDHATETTLANLGWQVLTIWQCEVSDEEDLSERLVTFLDGNQENSVTSRSAGVR